MFINYYIFTTIIIVVIVVIIVEILRSSNEKKKYYKSIPTNRGSKKMERGTIRVRPPHSVFQPHFPRKVFAR